MANPDYEISLLVPAMTFTGSEYVEKTIPTSIPLGSSVALTMEMWVRPTQTTVNKIMMHYGADSTIAEILFWMRGAPSAWALGGVNNVSLIGGSPQSGYWTHLGGVFTGSIGN